MVAEGLLGQQKTLGSGRDQWAAGMQAGTACIARGIAASAAPEF